MSTTRMYFNTERLNDILAGKADPRAKIASILERVIDDKGVEQEKWHNVYVATDQKTGKVRHTEKMELVLNVKPQRPRREPASIVDPAATKQSDDFQETWKE